MDKKRLLIIDDDLSIFCLPSNAHAPKLFSYALCLEMQRAETSWEELGVRFWLEYDDAQKWMVMSYTINKKNTSKEHINDIQVIAVWLQTLNGR